MGKLSIDDFLLLWASESGTNASPKTMRKYYDGFLTIILKQLELNGEIDLYQFGKFKLSQTGGKTVKLNNIMTGEMERKWCAPKLRASWIPSGFFIRSINENGFEMVKVNHKPRRYSSKRQAQKVYNERRRKPKQSLESGILDIFNDMDRKGKEIENGENTNN